MKVGAIILLLSFALYLLSGAGISGFLTARQEKVIIADIPITQSAPLYYAVEKGLFKQEGIDVELVRFDSPKQIVDAVVLKQVDMGGPGSATGISAIAESIQNESLKYYSFSCHFNETGTSLLVRKDSNISSIAELKNKRVGKLVGIQWTTIAKKILLVNNVDPKSVELVDLAIPVQLQALEARHVDALIAIDPIGKIGVMKGIARVAVAGVAQKNVADPLCAGAGIISTKFMLEKPETARKALKALKKAFVEFRRERHPEILVKYLNMDNSTAEVMPFPLQEFVFYDEITIKQKEATQEFLDLFYEEGVIKSKVGVQSMILRERDLVR